MRKYSSSFDKHEFNTPETTHSGNVHGMPLAALCGLGDQHLVQLWEEAAPVIDPARVAIIGARDLDESEKRNLSQAWVMVFSMEQVDRLGLVASMEKAIEQISPMWMASISRSIWMSWIPVIHPELELRSRAA